MAGRDAIVAEALGKRYRLGQTGSGLLSERLAILFSRGSERADPQEADFWALRDVSFEIAPGEVVGLVGRNGAGKSTLLKLIARITAPTEGRAFVRGRVGTLLEVGTGFHPELSGRENVFLNGAVLGMRRREIASKYDEIVEFAGVERFIETPVKRYSSGMYVRLAFAVAAHLEPEILLVDEVLAVGDVEFQRKCLGKMRDVASHGRTVVFVSHNVGAIRRLCDRVLLFENGALRLDGDPATVIDRYLTLGLPEQDRGSTEIPVDASRLGTGEARLSRAALSTLDGGPLGALHLDERFRVTLELDAGEQIDDAVFEVGVSTFAGDRVLTANSVDREQPPHRVDAGRSAITVELDGLLLPGEFVVDLGIHRHNGVTVDYVQNALRFTVLNSSESGADHYPWTAVRGSVRPHARWSEVSAVAAIETGRSGG